MLKDVAPEELKNVLLRLVRGETWLAPVGLPQHMLIDFSHCVPGDALGGKELARMSQRACLPCLLHNTRRSKKQDQ